MVAKDLTHSVSAAEESLKPCAQRRVLRARVRVVQKGSELHAHEVKHCAQGWENSEPSTQSQLGWEQLVSTLTGVLVSILQGKEIFGPPLPCAAPSTLVRSIPFARCGQPSEPKMADVTCYAKSPSQWRHCAGGQPHMFIEHGHAHST